MLVIRLDVAASDSGDRGDQRVSAAREVAVEFLSSFFEVPTD